MRAHSRPAGVTAASGFLLAAAGWAAVYGVSPQASAASAAPFAEAAATAHGVVILFGDGVAGAHFGQAEAAVTAGLDKAFGTAKSPKRTNESGNCTIDAASQWPAVTAYFDRGKFVGYSTLSPIGDTLRQTNVATAEGLRVGDTLAEARRIYGAALRTSYAQGGSWFAKTANGTVDGYLSTEVGQKSPPPRILSIEAGSVGCPASSP